MKPVLIFFLALLVLAHPVAAITVASAAAHIILVAELAFLAVITAGIARAAGVRRYWRVRRFVPWTP